MEFVWRLSFRRISFNRIRYWKTIDRCVGYWYVDGKKFFVQMMLIFNYSNQSFWYVFGRISSRSFLYFNRVTCDIFWLVNIGVECSAIYNLGLLLAQVGCWQGVWACHTSDTENQFTHLALATFVILGGTTDTGDAIETWLRRCIHPGFEFLLWKLKTFLKDQPAFLEGPFKPLVCSHTSMH